MIDPDTIIKVMFLIGFSTFIFYMIYVDIIMDAVQAAKRLNPAIGAFPHDLYYHPDIPGEIRNTSELIDAWAKADWHVGYLPFDIDAEWDKDWYGSDRIYFMWGPDEEDEEE